MWPRTQTDPFIFAPISSGVSRLRPLMQLRSKVNVFPAQKEFYVTGNIFKWWKWTHRNWKWHKILSSHQPKWKWIVSGILRYIGSENKLVRNWSVTTNPTVLKRIITTQRCGLLNYPTSVVVSVLHNFQFQSFQTCHSILLFKDYRGFFSSEITHTYHQKGHRTLQYLIIQGLTKLTLEWLLIWLCKTKIKRHPHFIKSNRWSKQI